MYTLWTGRANRVDLWLDQAPTAPDYDSLRLRFTKQGKKSQLQISVTPEVTAFAGGLLLAFDVQVKGLPPFSAGQLGNVSELGNWFLYVEGTNNGTDYTLLHTNQAKILEEAPAELVVDGGPSEDVARGVIDGGTP